MLNSSHLIVSYTSMPVKHNKQSEDVAEYFHAMIFKHLLDFPQLLVRAHEILEILL